MTRTLWVTNDFPPRAGGIETFLGGLVQRLPAGSVTVLTAPWPEADRHDADVGYRIQRVGRRPLLPTPALAARVHAAVRATGAQVVVFGAAWPLGELGAGLDVPALALTHGHEAGMTRAGGGPLVRRVARRVDALGVISRWTGAQLAPWVADCPRVELLPPGVDIGTFRPDVDGSGVRRRFGIAGDQPVAVCVGRLVARKGQDVLVEAWPSVLRAVPDACLLLAGDGPLAGRLRRRVGALGLRRSVMLLGEVRRADLPALHAAADVFTMPCRSRLGGLDVEGLGIVFLEAQASGVPVVAGSSGGVPEALQDGETGVLVNGGDRRAVADAVAGLLGDPARSRAMGAAGRAFVERRYAWEVVAQRFRDVLDDIATRPPARGVRR